MRVEIVVSLGYGVLCCADDLWDNDQQQLWHRLLEGVSSPLCEVLGSQQRRWLQQQLQGSKAALNIIASGSVLAGAPYFAVMVWCLGQG